MCELLFHTQMLHFHLISKGLGNLSGQVTAKSLSSIKREDQSLWCFAQNTYPLPPHPRRGARFQTRHVNGGIFFWNSSRGGQNGGGGGSIFCGSSVGGTCQGWSIFLNFQLQKQPFQTLALHNKIFKVQWGEAKGEGHDFWLKLSGGWVWRKLWLLIQ